MSYTLHNFLAGQPLTAEALNEMDNQIKKNTDAAETYTSQMVDERIANLSLRTDGEWLILSYGDVEIAEVAIASVADIIPCEALELTSPAINDIYAGDTFTITCNKSPSDSNQMSRYRSETMSVASVDSTGLVTGKDVGTAIINVMCGRFTIPVTVNVSKVIKPTWRIGNWLSIANVTSGGTGLMIGADNNKRLIVFPYEGETPVFVKAGQKVKIQPDNNHGLHMFWTITPSNGGLSYDKTWSDNDAIGGATCTDVGGSDTMALGTSYEYTAVADCYVAFMVYKKDFVDFTEQEAELVNDTGAVTITVSPA